MKLYATRLAAPLLATTLTTSYCHEGSHEPQPSPSNLIRTAKAASQLAELTLPSGLPQNFSLQVPCFGHDLTVHLKKNSIFGANTRILVDSGGDELTEIQTGPDSSYLGHVDGHPNLTVSAILSERGLSAFIIRPGEESIVIEPTGEQGNSHRLSIGTSGDYTEGTTSPVAESEELAASIGPVFSIFSPAMSAVALESKSTATLPPERKMDVLEFEIGVEIGSRAFLADTYGSSLEKAKASAQSVVSNLDARFLHSAGIKHRLGTVIIRTDAEKDPLRNQITRNSREGLDAFMNYWNNNADEVGNTHDLAVYHVYSAPSGIAYVNTVGSRRKYALSCGRGATSWADGTIAHEFGHSWNLHHNNKSGFFYEARPRNNRGATSAGGNDYHVSIMHGGGNHNIGRLSTEEANMVSKIRNERRRFGDPVPEPGPIRPYGHRDLAFCKDHEPLTIDVIANDYDCNNDPLDARLLDSVSYHGGAVTLSPGTGPGGRNELVYTPPKGFVGRDFFHYQVFDPSGLSDWGAVYVTVDGPIAVDTTLKTYNYDLGPQSSPVESGWKTITPDTSGDINWSPGSQLEARDRGASRGINNINRDFIFSANRAQLNHKLANGRWAITINMGDRSRPHDKMKVLAEGKEIGFVDSSAGTFPYVNGEVDVRDGVLNLEFSDAGGKDPNWVVTRLSLEKR
ncbi:Ig-like domain-containing protein [Roseibacillus persicicus]|uniref:Ig-like domain-containing protein n=1 Tax=Roseibacillus persicicus TaxID=454148 RepID=UPI00280EAFFB|nr:M12 family metallo-peptidase [Roseibacillus persicicus]MDQ8191129.1 M12 family metallo-peptidase [Roseibacillus persicicus]